jgi:hypothetical protein
MPCEHGFHHRLEGLSFGNDDLPQDSIVDPKVLVADAIADSSYLSLRLRWEVGEPVVRNVPTASEMAWIA